MAAAALFRPPPPHLIAARPPLRSTSAHSVEGMKKTAVGDPLGDLPKPPGFWAWATLVGTFGVVGLVWLFAVGTVLNVGEWKAAIRADFREFQVSPAAPAATHSFGGDQQRGVGGAERSGRPPPPRPRRLHDPRALRGPPPPPPAVRARQPAAAVPPFVFRLLSRRFLSFRVRAASSWMSTGELAAE